MEEKERKPKIRFKGFTEAWEQRKVAELFKITRGYVLPATETGTSWSKEKPYPVYSSQTKDDGLMGYHSEYLYENAITWTTDGANAGTVNYRIGKFYCTNVCGVLLSDKVKANKMISEAINNVAKGYVSYVGNPKLMNNVMADIDIYISKDEKEREKISEVFESIDNLITLHQRKYDKLVNVKKALLEKMFPKNDSNVPEIRFKGFTEAWEQRKFSNIFEYERPDKYIVNSDEYVEISKTPVLTANKAFILGYTLENNVYKRERESIIFDDFTLDTKFVDFPYMVKSSAIKILTLKNKSTDNLRFNYELLSNTKFNMLGHARHYISVVQPEEVYTTKKTEQDKIANLFSNLDNLITLHQRKLEKLKNIKKSLLEKMFV